VRVAVSFCNQHSTPKLAACVVDLDTDERAWLPVPDSFDRGAAGISQIDDDLLVACQPGGVVRYGLDLQPVAMLPTPNARNLHSILYRAADHSLYVTSAHNDTLFRYHLDESGTDVVATDEVYCADAERRAQDRYHLNSVTEWRGDIYVTQFGPADGPTHKHRRNGRLIRVKDREVVADGLYHPHSAYAHGDDLLVVESQARVVRRVAGGPETAWEIAHGYPRGIVAGGDGRVWVGVSAMRRESSSLGTPNVITSSSPVDFQTRLVELDLTSGTIGRTIDLTLLAAEVFDVRALPAEAKFEPSADGGKAERIEALEASFRDMRGRRRELEQQLERTPLRRLEHFTKRARRRFLHR
jgi:hypothetical protein